MLNATRIRLYPTQEQVQTLAVQFGCARWVWNDALATTQKLYQETLSRYGDPASSTQATAEWLKDTDSQVLQSSLSQPGAGLR